MHSTGTFTLFALFAGASALGLRVDTNGVTVAQEKDTATPVNVAQRCGSGSEACTATQSNTPFNSHRASKALDGNSNTGWTSTCTHTSNDDAPSWWKVDLGYVRSITSVNVVGTSHSVLYANLNSGFTIRVGNNEDYSQNAACATGVRGPFSAYQTTVDCVAEGQYVSIEIPNKALALCEVAVFGHELKEACPSRDACIARTAQLGYKWDGDRNWADREPGCLESPGWAEVNWNTNTAGTKTGLSQIPFLCFKEIPAPTPAPAPAPAPGSAAKGDPHLMNMKGEAFDVMQTGNMMLLEIPRGSSPATLDLALHADIEHLGVVSCGPTFITSASITGRWIGVPLEIRSGHIAEEGHPQKRHTFAIRFDGKAWVPHAEMQRIIELSKNATITAQDRMFLFQVRGLDIAVSQPKRPRMFLDIQVKGLGNLKTEIGGLLGIDDHGSVEELPSGCEMSTSSLALAASKEDEALQWSARAML